MVHWDGAVCIQINEKLSFFTSRKQSLRRLRFYTCLSVILFTGWILRARDRDRDILTRLRLGHQRPVNRGCPIVRFRGSLWQVTQPFPEIGQWPY